MPRTHPRNSHDSSLAPLVEFARRHAYIELRGTSIQRWSHGYELQRRRLTQHNFIFVTRGRVVWVIDEDPIELRAGDLAIVPPGIPHHGYSRTQRVTLLSLHITAQLPGGQSVFDVLVPPLHQSVARDTALDFYLRGALSEYDRVSNEDARLMLASWARLITLELLDDNAARGLLEAQPLDPIVTELMNALTRRIDAPTDLPELAAWAGYSAQHLNRLFRRQIGVTPLQYLTRLRMQRAATLLAEARWTVQAIAEAVGYDDPYYFSRLFKQHLGQSPAQYRAAAGEAAGAGRGSDSPSPGSAGPFPRAGR